MGFKLTKDDLKKSALCPPGIHNFTLVNIEEPYVKPNGNTVQKCDFETDNGYVIPVWFNANMISSIFDFVAAADKVTFSLDTFSEMEIDLKNYKGKRVSGNVSHRADDNNKPQAQIDSFYAEGKVPF